MEIKLDLGSENLHVNKSGFIFIALVRVTKTLFLFRVQTLVQYVVSTFLDRPVDNHYCGFIY